MRLIKAEPRKHGLQIGQVKAGAKERYDQVVPREFLAETRLGERQDPAVELEGPLQFEVVGARTPHQLA
jgi:hypothetical protein